MMTILQYASPSMAASMEGFIKGLHNKFQIPKLSQRSNTGSAAGGGGRTTPNTDQTTATMSSSSSSQELQSNVELNALSTGISAGSSGQQKPTTTAPPAANDLPFNLSSTGVSGSVPGQGPGDGIDEELLARLAGE